MGELYLTWVSREYVNRMTKYISHHYMLDDVDSLLLR